MVTASIPYTIDTGETLVNETFGPNNIRRRKTGAVDMHSMPIEDGRTASLTLERNGFVLVEHKTAVKSFFDPEELKAVYYPEVEALIKRCSGARRVVIFDHTLRSGDEGEREEKLIREPVLSAHNDYTEWSGPQRVRDLMLTPDFANRRTLFYIVFACAVTVSVQLVGLYLVFSSLIVPALATRQYRGYRITAAYAVGGVGYLLGLVVSVLTDLPTGPAIVWTMAIVGTMAFLLGPKTVPATG